MVLLVGARVGAYEVLAPIGQGGMGEVYRARDLKLKREVALKILPDVWSRDEDRLARFQREAELLATVSHPNIAAVYGLEQSGDTTAIVLELVEGDTLEERLRRSRLPLDETLAIARQIIEALEAAHDRGIVHRDLKPANIKITPADKVKVLDFGLAKMTEVDRAPSSLTMSPTLSIQATQAGVVLGTAAYMSPEQARGKPVDRRTDIWAFGCILFEMLAGKQTFDPGETVSDAVAAILRGEPEWESLPADTPQTIRSLLRRCLQKDPQKRLPHIAVARLEIDEMQSAPAPEAPPGSQATRLERAAPSRRRLAVTGAVGVAIGIVLTAGGAWLWSRLTPTAKPQPMRFAIVPPIAQAIGPSTTDRQLAISPDGTHLAYITGIGGSAQLVVRAIDRLEAAPLRGAAAPRFPFFSPDGKWVGYFQAASELKKISIDGGPAVTVCAITGAPRGATWGQDDTIVFATNETSTGLLSVPASGGEPKVLTKPDLTHGELDHYFPSMLPGGRALLFTIVGNTGQGDNHQVAVLDLQSGQQKILVRGGSDAQYAESGHLVYASAGTLRGVRFDPVRLQVLGDPTPILDQLAVTNAFAAEFALSRTGTLVYVPGGLSSMDLVGRTVVSVNRQGREEPIRTPLRPYDHLRLSPDGKRLALFSGDQENDIWIWDVTRETLSRFTFGPAPDILPVWTPDGRRIIFASQRAGPFNLYWQSADGTGAVERLTTAPNAQSADSISPDGKRVVIREQSTKTGSDLSLLTLDEKRAVTPLLQSPFDERNADISPDGRWLAFESNESGQLQVYVRPFPDVNAGRWQISTAGGTRAKWGPNGRELFYIDGQNRLTVVAVQGASNFSAGNPMPMFTLSPVSNFSNGLPYDVTRDGQHFVVIKDAQAQRRQSNDVPASMVVVLNWVEELKTRFSR